MIRILVSNASCEEFPVTGCRVDPADGFIMTPLHFRTESDARQFYRTNDINDSGFVVIGRRFKTHEL